MDAAFVGKIFVDLPSRIQRQELNAVFLEQDGSELLRRVLRVGKLLELVINLPSNRSAPYFTRERAG
jgi:hypothetical protein